MRAFVLVDLRVPVLVSTTTTFAAAAGDPSKPVMVPLIDDVCSCAFDATGITSTAIATRAAIGSRHIDAKVDRVNRDLYFIIDPRLVEIVKA